LPVEEEVCEKEEAPNNKTVLLGKNIHPTAFMKMSSWSGDCLIQKDTKNPAVIIYFPNVCSKIFIIDQSLANLKI
jgi:hypothetical protein